MLRLLNTVASPHLYRNNIPFDERCGNNNNILLNKNNKRFYFYCFFVCDLEQKKVYSVRLLMTIYPISSYRTIRVKHVNCPDIYEVVRLRKSSKVL
jgi:hypothetical protein